MRALAIGLAVAALAVAGCGESEEEQARDDVCDARADIGQKVEELEGLTLATAGEAPDLVRAIGDDVQKIADAQGDLDDERRQQVESANQQFGDAVEKTLNGLAGGTPSGGELEGAVDELAAAYREAYGPIDCD